MKRPLAVILLLCSMAVAALGLADSPEDNPRPAPAVRPAVRFESFDITLDPADSPLAAYQIEVAPSGPSVGRIKIVGIEGGTGPFAHAPYYDPKAIQGEIAILGALSQGPAQPGPARVARVHIMAEGPAPTQLTIRLITAGEPTGSRLTATASIAPANR